MSVLLLTFALQSTLKLERLATLDVPRKAPEIVSVDASGTLLAHNDAVSRSVEFYELDVSAKVPKLTQLRSVPFGSEPTSVAFSRQIPIAYATVIGGLDPRQPGTLNAIDPRTGNLDAVLWSVPVGLHPDSVALTPDGRFALTADEGQEERGYPFPTAGTVSVVALPEGKSKPSRTWTLNPADVLAIEADKIEPEYVAVDPRSRFAVVTCQENDAAVVVDLSGEEPKLSKVVFKLPLGAEPDGASVLDGYVDSKLGAGALVAFAEEGRKEKGERLGQCVSFHWLGPEPSFDRAVELARVNVGELCARTLRRADPEAVALARRGSSLLALVGSEYCDCVLLFDLADPRAPVHVGNQPVGLHPEGLTVLQLGGRTLAITGDEGDDGKGPGEVSFLEITGL